MLLDLFPDLDNVTVHILSKVLNACVKRWQMRHLKVDLVWVISADELFGFGFGSISSVLGFIAN